MRRTEAPHTLSDTLSWRCAAARPTACGFVNFQFTIVGAPGSDGALPITFSNKVVITDLDGDQLFFDNTGTGAFHVGFPGDAFVGVGGPQTGTYVLTGGTGKYAVWTVGATYPY